MLADVLTYLRNHEEESIKDLQALLRIPSISTEPGHNSDVRIAAVWIRDFFLSCAIRSPILETLGHPCVLADSGPAESSGPTLLVYGHYDVQPVGDEKLWTSPPFEPTVRGGAIFARGAADDKGQLCTHLLATQAWMKSAGRLPIRVKFLIEGEEEACSSHLESTLRRHQSELACDCAVISDTTKFDDNTPAITYGTRGIVYKQIIVTGPSRDLHSGTFGGTVANPANELASIIASLHDDFGRVRIPGFYDDVRPVSDDEETALNDLSFDDRAYQTFTGSPALCGEAGHDTLHRRWLRPTLDVNGMSAGPGGQGLLTIIPALASANVSMRLVPDQDPRRIAAAFDDAVRSACPPGVHLEIVDYGSSDAYVAPIDLPIMGIAAEAIEAGFGRRPVFVREGGTLPVLSLFKRVLDVDTLLLGFALPNCGAHAPNEFLMLGDFHCGTRAVAELLHRVGVAHRSFPPRAGTA